MDKKKVKLFAVPFLVWFLGSSIIFADVRSAESKSKTEYYFTNNMVKKNVAPNVTYKNGKISISAFYGAKSNHASKLDFQKTKKYSGKTWETSKNCKIKVWEEVDEKFVSYNIEKYVKLFGKKVIAPALVIKIQNGKVVWIKTTV